MNFIQTGRALMFAVLASLFIALVSCSSVVGPRYYAHMAAGQADIFTGRTSISKILKDPESSAELKENLRGIEEMRRFAIYELGLPVTDSFTSYADTGREYVQWTLTATPEFSVTPKIWCFPIAGCTSYLVFFDESYAKETKATLIKQGYDVSVRGATAYSTAGWFADPVTNTIFGRSLPARANVVFHEKAHEKMRAKDDTAWSEAFATFVGQTGEYRWIVRHYGKEEAEKFLVHEKRTADFSELIITTRRELRALYKEDHEQDEMRVLKNELFEKMRTRYELLKMEWEGYSGYDNWIAKPLNNADIVGEDEYRKFVPFFQKLFKLSGYNFPAFYEKAEAMAKLSKAERYAEIEKLMEE